MGTMITQGQESCLHTPVWGVEGFNISTSKEVEGELTTGKQLTRVFNGLVEENTTKDTAMTNTINFDDLLLEETVFVSTSIAPMDMIEEEENLTIEKNTVPLSEDTTNIMEMIENAEFDFTLPEPLPTTTLHMAEHKAEVEQMVEVETSSTWTSLDDANLGLCLPAIEAEGRIELPVTVVGNNVESSEADDLLKRKRKLAEEEQELTILQEKNIRLQAVFKSMQEEVALYKKRILEQVSGVRN